ncbi:ATP-binding protein [Blautia sp. MSJ-19]|uniref:ATP-binding protein n=1 Tax=Blautia sp. MSJ-19 TaxID=2841517 RepID=UPI001C0EA172|nr:ATP-binding protein [Blautia sp. MSJ-19]MBU5482017.1 response regulator [Blautia sp. MSJ-19]
MKKLLSKSAQLLLYGGLKREQYKLISAEITEANRKSISVLSFACLLVFALRLCLKYSRVPDSNQIVFMAGIILFGVLALANTIIKNAPYLVHISAYLFMTFYLGIGILSSIGEGSIRERTTLYLVFIVVAPMLFALNALEIAVVVIPAEIIYLLLIGKYQSGYAVYATNKGNSLFFAITGLLLGIYMTNRKISGIYSTYMSARAEEIKALNIELDANRRELQKALVSAENANRAKTSFLNSMSHDIRTPMNAIIGFTTLAKTHIDDQELVSDYLDKISVSSQHLLSLINDVLDMSRIESGKVKIEEKPLSLSELVHDIQTISQAGVSSRQLDFKINTELVVHDTIVGDSLRIHQILLNIIGNAVKFTPAGGEVSFTIIEKDTAPSGYADYEFHIRDTGIGMSKEFQKHIFEAFSREETATVSRIQGTGLGMSITKNLIDLMNGSVTVDSEEGKGTEFTVFLRFAVCDTIIQTSPDPAPDFTGKKILLVEDNELNREIAESILADNGFTVDTAFNGIEAVSQIQSTAGDTYDLILMDIQMPGMNGYEATRQIRSMKDPVRSSIPIIAMTANAFAEDRQAALDAGMNEHIAKPVDVQKLLKILSQCRRD